MKRHHRIALFLGALFLVACGGETTKEVEVEVAAATVAVSGDVALMVGETTDFTAVTDPDGEDTGYIWGSSDEMVATVVDGTVTGLAAGTAIITATGMETEAAGSWGIHVYEEGTGPGATPRVFVTGDLTVKVGATAALAAETVDGEDTGYTWESSNEDFATVDEDGVVTGVAVGAFTVTATGAETGEAGTWNMYVWDEAAVVMPDPTVSVDGPLSLTMGETGQLEVTTANGEDSGYTFESSKEEVATVDEMGLVSALAAGEVLFTITGADTGATAVFGIVVLDSPPVVPFEELWAESGHADASAEAFRHWDEDEPAEVPASCAKCHSAYGYLDYLGVDGTDFGVVDNAAATDSVISCVVCHNSATVAMDTVTFPSGAVIDGLGPEARCMQCHQGRESTTSVNASIEAAAPVDDDTVTEGIGFKNVHYFAAGATLYGGEAKGGYQYDGKAYIGKFDHAGSINGCADCHNPHSLEVKLTVCTECHAGVAEEADLVAIRMAGSNVDFDGDAADEGTLGEIEGLRDALYVAIQGYATDTIGEGLIYDSHAYPYFFIDTNGNGEADEDEVNYGNKYAQWTARLLRAAYNFQYSQKDPGAFAHNNRYVLQLLYDSIEDLGADIADLRRDPTGHFNGGSEAFRHWDEDGGVSASCAKCHSSDGFKFLATEDLNVANSQPASWGLSCDVCHTGVDYADGAPLRYIASVEFPNGFMLENDAENPDNSFICLTCHQGRSSGADVDAAIAADSLKFKNIHYLPVGATIFGGDGGAGYEYGDNEYEAAFGHFSADATKCEYCHTPTAEDHSFHPKLSASCTGCHSEATDGIESIRKNRGTDYDGDGDTDENLADELHTLADALYAEMQASADADGNPLIYSPTTYPYFFADTNGNGEVDEGEAAYANSYKSWTPATLKASFNFQFYQKEHGAWAHHTNYMAQLLFDSIEDLGGDVEDFNRP
jgi:hypothetical protein